MTELTVTETGLPLGEAMPVTEIVKVASVPLAANSAVVGPTSVIDVGPAGTMSLKRDRTDDWARPGTKAHRCKLCRDSRDEEVESAAETGQAWPEAIALVLAMVQPSWPKA